MTRNISLFLALFVVLGTNVLAADATDAGKNAAEKPISVAFGPQKDGGYGVTVKGSTYPDLPFLTQGRGKIELRPGFVTPSAFLYLSPEANWSTKTDAKNQLSISARPTLQFGYQKRQPRDGNFNDIVLSRVLPNQAPFFTLYADGRRQSGDVASSSGTVSRVNATFIGFGAGLAVPFLAPYVEKLPGSAPGDFPMLRYARYKSRGENTTDATIASGIKPNHDDISLAFAVPVVTSGKLTARLDFDGDRSRATSGDDRAWKDLIKAALSLKFGKSEFKPVISYTSGTKLGFKFDRQVLVGIVVDALGLSRKGS